jgi:hypothetical protein
MSTRARAIHEADAEMEAAVFAVRAGRDGFQYGHLFYDEVLSRAMRRRKAASARIDAEWPAAGEEST